jgi:predicted signal transduction protein with EAL and GGDEF domain
VEPDRHEAGLTPDDLLHRADGAMYVGKRRGKGMTVHYHPDLVNEVGYAPAR